MNKPDFSGLRLMVIGDVILDKFIYTTNNRMSPEHPVPVYDIIKTKTYPGGAANVAANILALGAQVDLVSILGVDTAAEELYQLLRELNCSVNNVLKDTSRKTTVKSRIFCDDEPISRIDDEKAEDICNNLETQVLERSRELIKTQVIDGIILQDYNKGVLTEYLIAKVMEIAKKHEIPVFVDPKTKNYSAYAGARVFKPNLNEISDYLGKKPIIALKSLAQADHKLRTYVEYDTLVLTLSEKGAYFSNLEESGVISTQSIPNADVCGAGDSFIAALSLCICSKLTISESITIANRVSGVVCGKSGVQTCNKSEY